MTAQVYGRGATPLPASGRPPSPTEQPLPADMKESSAGCRCQPLDAARDPAISFTSVTSPQNAPLVLEREIGVGDSSTLDRMNTLARSLTHLRGIAATHELLAAGHSEADLKKAILSGTIRRVRKGWYCRPDLHPQIQMAARVGGVLGCVSALGLHGGWTPERTPLHVMLALNAARPRSPRDPKTRLDASRHRVVLHWSGMDGERLMTGPLRSMREVLLCLAPDFASAAIAVALHMRPDLRTAWMGARMSMPHASDGWVGRIDHICESGTEVLWWFRMHRHRLPARRQVTIERIGRVDFLIGQRLVVEVDGAEYHTDPEAFESDRRRDAKLSVLGYRVLRFSYRMVLDGWPLVEAAVLAAVARGDAN